MVCVASVLIGLVQVAGFTLLQTSALVEGGPDAIAWLASLGVAFSREGERYRVIRCGGASRERLLQAGERTGADMVQALQTAAPPLSARLPGLTTARPVPAAAVLSLQELSSAAIDQALQSARGNVSQAARQLGISRQTLYRKLAARVH